MTIKEYLSTPDGRAAYQRWISSPETKQVLALISDELLRPVGMIRPEPNDALYLHGMFIGMHALMTALKDLTRLSAVGAGGSSADVEPVAGYGMEDILKALGYEYKNGEVRIIPQKQGTVATKKGGSSK